MFFFLSNVSFSRIFSYLFLSPTPPLKPTPTGKRIRRLKKNERLYKDDTILEDGKTLADCGFTSQTARAQAPATVGLAVREGDAWETLDVVTYSTPPELPDVMKPQEASTAAHPAEQTAA